MNPVKKFQPKVLSAPVHAVAVEAIELLNSTFEPLKVSAEKFAEKFFRNGIEVILVRFKVDNMADVTIAIGGKGSAVGTPLPDGDGVCQQI